MREPCGVLFCVVCACRFDSPVWSQVCRARPVESRPGGQMSWTRRNPLLSCLVVARTPRAPPLAWQPPLALGRGGRPAVVPGRPSPRRQPSSPGIGTSQVLTPSRDRPCQAALAPRWPTVCRDGRSSPAVSRRRPAPPRHLPGEAARHAAGRSAGWGSPRLGWCSPPPAGTAPHFTPAIHPCPRAPWRGECVWRRGWKSEEVPARRERPGHFTQLTRGVSVQKRNPACCDPPLRLRQVT